MDKYKRYYGVMAFAVVAVFLIFASYKLIVPQINALQSVNSDFTNKTQEKEKKNQELMIVKNKIKKIKDSNSDSQKKIYSPVDSDLGDNDTLFFTLYNDVIEMVHANSVKIKAINYKYSPSEDAFVKSGKPDYFVCDVDMELVSNYTNLGKLIQDLYQYPYYIKLNELTVEPYAKDKRILLSNLSIRLYAHTSPEEPVVAETGEDSGTDAAVGNEDINIE